MMQPREITAMDDDYITVTHSLLTLSICVYRNGLNVNIHLNNFRSWWSSRLVGKQCINIRWNGGCGRRARSFDAQCLGNCRQDSYESCGQAGLTGSTSTGHWTRVSGTSKQTKKKTDFVMALLSSPPCLPWLREDVLTACRQTWLRDGGGEGRTGTGCTCMGGAGRSRAGIGRSNVTCEKTKQKSVQAGGGHDGELIGPNCQIDVWRETNVYTR